MARILHGVSHCRFNALDGKKRKMKMKKVMFVLSAFAIALVSQAAVVDWSYTVKNDKTVSSKAAAEASAYAKNYVVYMFAAGDFDSATFTKDSLSGAKDSSALAFKSYVPATGATYATASEVGTVGGTRTVDVGTAASFDAVFVVVDTVNDTWTYSTKTLTSRSETEGAGSSGAISLTQTEFSTMSQQSFGPVPEPTSGLLLCLGFAGLMLKRKRN